MSLYDFKVPLSFDKIDLGNWCYGIDTAELGRKWMEEVKKNEDYKAELTYQIMERKNSQLREKELEIENLKLKLEMEKLKNKFNKTNVQDEENLKRKRNDIDRKNVCDDNLEPIPGTPSKPIDPSVPMDNDNIPSTNVNKRGISYEQNIKGKECGNYKDFLCKSNKSSKSDNVLEKVTMEEIEEEYRHGGKCLDVDSETILMDEQ